MEHLTESELRAKAKLKNYINHLEGTKRTQFKSSLKDLRIKGDSWEFISEMLFFKPLDVWDKYGYGLLFNKGYRSQVWNLMNAAFEEDEELDSLFDDSLPCKLPACEASLEEPEPQEEPEDETNGNDDSPQSGLPANGKEPFFYNRKGEAYTFDEIAGILSECPTPKETFNLMWGRYPESQEAMSYYKEELEKLF